MNRQFFTKDVDITDTENSTVDNCVVFPQYLPHRFPKELAAEGESTYKTLIKATTETSGGRKAVLPTNFPPLAEYELTNSLLSAEATIYMQTLFYVTGGVIPFIAPDILSSGANSTHQLVSFDGDLTLDLEQTDYSVTYNNKSEAVFEESDFFGNLTDDIDYTRATVTSRVAQLHSIEDGNWAEVVSDEWDHAPGASYIESMVEVDACAPETFGRERRMVFIDSSSTNLLITVQVSGRDPFGDSIENTYSFMRGYPTDVYRQARISSNKEFIFYSVGGGGAIDIVDIFTGTDRNISIPAPYNLVTDVLPYTLYGVSGFVYTATTTGGTGGILVFQPIKGDEVILETFTSLIPTAILSPTQEEIIIALSNQSTTLSFGVYTLDTGFTRLVDQIISPEVGAPSSWAISSLTVLGRQAFGVAVATGASDTFMPIFINLYTGEVFGNNGVLYPASANNNLLVTNPTTNDNYFTDLVKGPDGLYILVPSEITALSNDFSQGVERPVPHTANYRLAANSQVIQNLYSVKLISPENYNVSKVRVAAETASNPGLANPHVLTGMGEFLGTPVTGMTSGATISLIPALNQHQSFCSLKAVRTNTRKPYPSSRINTLDAGIMDDANIVINGTVYGYVLPTDPNIASQGVVDYIVRDDEVYAVELYYHTGGDNPRIQSRILDPTFTSALPPGTDLIIHAATPADHGVIAGAPNVLYWNDTALNILPSKLLAEATLAQNQELPSVVTFGQNFVAFDVGIKTFMRNSNNDIRAAELWSPCIEIDSIELSGELDTSNVTVRGHRSYPENPGERATQALGDVDSITPYAANIRADIDVLWLIGNTPVDPALSPICTPEFVNLFVTNEDPDAQGTPNPVKFNPAGFDMVASGVSSIAADMGTDFVQFGAFASASTTNADDALVYVEWPLFSYTPSIQGALNLDNVKMSAKWAYTFGLTATSSPVSVGNTGIYFACRQDGIIYIFNTRMSGLPGGDEGTGLGAPEETYGTDTVVGGVIQDNVMNRVGFSNQNNWVQKGLTLVSGNPEEAISDLGAHPDFSNTGSRICFGICFLHSRGIGTDTQENAIHEFTFSEFIVDFQSESDSAKHLYDECWIDPQAQAAPAPFPDINTGDGTFIISEGTSGLWVQGAQPSITSYNDAVIQQKGDSLTITAVPDVGSTFVEWLEDEFTEGQDLNNPVITICPDSPDADQFHRVAPVAIFDGPIIPGGGGS